jgi:tetratricopeptide (TPR) repeat protein
MMQRWHSATGQFVFLGALTLAGAGAGVAAALATSSSGIVRTAGGAAGGALGLAAATWIDKAHGRREDRTTALRKRSQVLDPVVVDPERDSSILGVLLPTRQDAPRFQGRTADLAWLEKWRDEPGAHPVMIVTGPAGVGKTRLVTQFASASPAPWVAGWLRPGCGASAVAAVRACDQPALILVDDADSRPDLGALLDDLAGDLSGPPVRVILITRTTESLLQTIRRLQESHRWILAPDKVPVRPAGPFGSKDDYARWFGEAVKAYAAARHTPPPDLPATTSRGIAGTVDEPILALHAQALLAVLDSERRRPQRRGAQGMPFDDVAAALFAHEQRRWQAIAERPEWGLAGLTAVVQDRAIAALMLAGAANEAEAVTALRWVPDLADAPAERLANIARWALSLYPSHPPGPIRIQPDMLAEWFLITQLAGTSELADHLSTLPHTQVMSVLTLLAHASDHMSEATSLYTKIIRVNTAGLMTAGVATALTAGRARPFLDAALASLIPDARWSPDALAELDRQLPSHVLPRTRVAVVTAIVNCAREAGTSEDLANALQSRGASLRDLGRYQEALADFEEALALWRELAAANPAHQPNLARTLQNRGASLRDLGRHQGALADFEEALALWRELAAANPAHQPSLANTLQNRGASLRDLGRHQEALADDEEALVLWRELAAANPAHQPNLAGTLQNRGTSVRDLGRYQEALADFEEALALWRELAAANPAHQPNLARTLQSRGASLRDLGRSEDALADFEEALALYRELAAANPAHQPSLANTLQNRGISLQDLGRHQEALADFEEALALWRELAAANPAHQPNLAGTLQNRGASLTDLGRHQEALADFEEALALYRELAAANPAHQPNLANTLQNRGISLRDLGRHQEALADFEEALALYRELAAANPAHQPNLANTLRSRGASLSDLGRHQEALADDEEALTLYRELAASDPGQYEKTYQRLLAELRRAYDLQGDYAIGAGLHLRDDVTGEQK